MRQDALNAAKNADAAPVASTSTIPATADADAFISEALEGSDVAGNGKKRERSPAPLATAGESVPKKVRIEEAAPAPVAATEEVKRCVSLVFLRLLGPALRRSG